MARVRDFHAAHSSLTIVQDKAGAGRVLQLPEAIAGLIAGLCAGRAPDAYMFRTAEGVRWTDSHLSRQIKHRMAEAGLPAGATAMAVRHGVLTDLIVTGVPLALVAELGGTSEQMLRAHYSKAISRPVPHRAGGPTVKKYPFDFAPHPGPVILLLHTEADMRAYWKLKPPADYVADGEAMALLRRALGWVANLDPFTKARILEQMLADAKTQPAITDRTRRRAAARGRTAKPSAVPAAMALYRAQGGTVPEFIASLPKRKGRVRIDGQMVTPAYLRTRLYAVIRAEEKDRAEAQAMFEDIS